MSVKLYGSPVLVRGGGDLGTGAAIALQRVGFDVVVVDQPRPTALRLTAAFAAACVTGKHTVGGVSAVHLTDRNELEDLWAQGLIPVWSSSESSLRTVFKVCSLVDARLRGLSDPCLSIDDAPLVIALGPGYEAQKHCHFVIETNRGPALGKVISNGTAQAHTGTPGLVMGFTEERVLRAPCDGAVQRKLQIGDWVEIGDMVAYVNGTPVHAKIKGMVRGLKLDGVPVQKGRKVADIDPRRNRQLLFSPSDKSAKVGAAVVRALDQAISLVRSSSNVKEVEGCI